MRLVASTVDGRTILAAWHSQPSTYTNIVVGILSVTDALHTAAVAAATLTAFRATAVDDIVPVDEQVAEIAARYRMSETSLRMPDALILATGDHLGAAAVLTADKRMARVAPTPAQLVMP